MTTSIVNERMQALMADRPLATATGVVMVVGLVVAMLFSTGYGVGKDRALADNRADPEQHDR